MNIIWVSTADGSDIIGNGSQITPYASIRRAIQAMSSGDQIRILPGTYIETDSVVVSGMDGSLFAEYPGTVFIQPAKTTEHQAGLAILDANRFSVYGITVLQARNPSGNNIGIYGENITTFLIYTCAVSDYEIPSGSGNGIFASGLLGRVENCRISNMTCGGGELYGIKDEGLDIIDCEVTSLSGVSDCRLWGMQAKFNNAYNTANTCITRGNTISDLQAEEKVIGIQGDGFINFRSKNNKVVRLKSKNESIGFDIRNMTNTSLIYNVASRCDRGFLFNNAGILNVYNLTAHNCSNCVITNTNGIFKNIALSSYEDHKTYKNCIGFTVGSGIIISVDYMYHFNLGTLYNIPANINEGNTVEAKIILYMDEPNDDLTPDHISELVNSGTDNPLRIENPCIGGIESEITDETTADRKYHYNLLDNSFWDIENPNAAEVIFTKSFQSRILANCEVAEKTVERNYYIKTAESTLRFSELYPMHSRYANQTKFKKRVADMWFSGQNPATIQGYQNAIGGYNLFPSFYKRIEDIQDGWIINESYIDIDNWLLGQEGQKYGILIDVLGLSTLSQEASGECYNNTMKSVADVATVRWNLHHEPEPNHYRLFTDLYNEFEKCELTNMLYNDDFNISPDIVQQNCQLVTPLISTEGIGTSGIVYTENGPVSGAGELSTLDRIWSENITRTMYYRVGEDEDNMSTWVEVEHPIGEIISLTSSYIQFKMVIENVLRQIDYEFQGLCLRPYSSARIWAEYSEEEEEMPYIELQPGAFIAATNPPNEGDGALLFPNDGINHNSHWCVYIPTALRTLSNLTMRFMFAAAAIGTVEPEFDFNGVNETAETVITGTLFRTITFAAPGPLGVDIGYVDINLTPYINANTSQLLVRISRDSSRVADTLAADLYFYNARAPYNT